MLTIEAQIEGAQLALRMIVTNAFSEPLYLQNWLFDWFGILGISELHANENKNAPPTREVAFTALGGPGEMVLLSGDGPPPPAGVSVFEPRVPYATRLPAGATYKGRISVPLPVREWYGYKSPEFQPTRSVRIRSVLYRLETVRESRCKEPVDEHVNFKGAFIVPYHPSDILDARCLLPRDVELLERTDAFRRFG